MTNNELVAYNAQQVLNNFFGSDNAVIVEMKEAWNFNATYRYSNSAWMDADGLESNMKELQTIINNR